jgi:hypothetical protein
LEVNNNEMKLVSIGKNSFKIRHEREISPSLKASTSAFLMNDTDLIVSYGYNKASVDKIENSNSTITLPPLESKSIEQLPENILPLIYSKREYVIIKADQSYIFYNLKSKKKKYLFSLQTDSDNNESIELFINDTIFAIIKGKTINYYRLNSPGNNFVYTKSQDTLLGKMAYNLLSINNEMNQAELFNLFPKEYTKGLVESYFVNGEYDSCISFSQRILKTSLVGDNKALLYKYLYDSYSNLKSSLPSTPTSVKDQLNYTRQMVKYANTLLLTTHDTATYYNDFLKALGSLSWFLIINSEYKSAMDTAFLAIRLDKYNEQQWIHTNLALGYLFNDSLPQALNIYRQWKNKNFNDDFEKGKVRFHEDIDNLKLDYGIDIRYKEQVLKELNY